MPQTTGQDSERALCGSGWRVLICGSTGSYFPPKGKPGHLIPCTGFCRSPAFEPTCHCGCEWGWVVGIYWMCWGLLQTPLLEHKMHAQLHVQRVGNEEGMCGCTHSGSLDCMFIGICHCHCQVTKLSRSRGHHHEHYFRIYS